MARLRILGVVPARGGSKGVPGKNIRNVAGRPLIEYTIEQGLMAKCIDRLIVSTDDERIAEISQKAGAEVPFIRPSELATDDARSVDVVMQAMRFYKELGHDYDVVCLLQPTSPIRLPGQIDDAVTKFESNDWDSLVSVVRVPHQFNPNWTFIVKDDDTLEVATGRDHIIPRRQELPPAFIRNGCIYLTRTSVLEVSGSLYGERIGYFVMDDRSSLNIDSEADIKKAAELLSGSFKR